MTRSNRLSVPLTELNMAGECDAVRAELEKTTGAEGAT